MNQSQQIIEDLTKDDLLVRYKKIADIFQGLGLALPPMGKASGQVQIKTTTKRSKHGIGVAWTDISRQGDEVVTPITIFMNKKFLKTDSTETEKGQLEVSLAHDTVLAHEMIHVHLIHLGDFGPGNTDHGDTFKAVERKITTKMKMDFRPL